MEQLSLTVKKNQMLALLGHNGAGKSTTINMLTGLLEPDGGKGVWSSDHLRWVWSSGHPRWVWSSGHPRWVWLSGHLRWVWLSDHLRCGVGWGHLR